MRKFVGSGNGKRVLWGWSRESEMRGSEKEEGWSQFIFACEVKRDPAC